MDRKILLVTILAFYLFSHSCNKVEPPAPCGPIPSENQMRWQEMEYYAFVHFSLNTYTDQSWGYGNDDINLFNPTVLG